MAKNQESINRSLFELLRSRGYAPTLLDTSGKEIPVPEEAEVFQFKFTKDGEEYGTVTASIDGLHKLIIYFGDDVANSAKGEGTDDDWSDFMKKVKKFKKSKLKESSGDDSWYKLLNHLKRFSQQHQLSFEVKNRDHLKYDMAKREHMKKQERISEGYYPMGKKASYNDNIPTVKIVIEHSRTIEEGEQRYRNVNRIFLENTQGERILAPTTKPGVAQIYARHLAEGGMPHDDRWNHIIGLCEEYNKMGAFVRAIRNNQFNESAQQLVNEGINHYQSLRESLSKMRGSRGYNSYFESYTPPLMEDETEENNLNELFVQETLDPRIESVMPILSKLHKKVAEMKEVTELSEWADSLTEIALEEGDGGQQAINPLGVPESKNKSIVINGKEVDEASLEVDGVDSGDYPDFSDAYFSAGSFTDGSEMSDEDLDQLADTYGELVNAKAYDSLIESDEEGKIYSSPTNEAVTPDPKYDHEPPAQESDPIPDDQESDPIPDDQEPELDEGIMDTIKKVGSKVFDKLGGGSNEDLLKDLQKKAGIPAQHGKPNMGHPKDEEQIKEVDMGQADSSLRSDSKQNNDKMDHFSALDKASKKMGHNHFMDVPDDKLEALRAMVKRFRSGEEVDESALQASFGIKKYGEDGMKELQRLGRENASKETIANAKAEYTSENVDKGLDDAHQADQKIKTPAVDRKEKGGDWKVTKQDLDKADEKNMTSSSGMAALQKKLFNIEKS